MAVVVVPNQPGLDWLHAVDAKNGDLTLAELASDRTFYLLPEFEDGNEGSL